jgi:hypothetical protein
MHTQYVATRFADRDKTLRYHWGQGVGHLYSRSHLSSDPSVTWKNNMQVANSETAHEIVVNESASFEPFPSEMAVSTGHGFSPETRHDDLGPGDAGDDYDDIHGPVLDDGEVENNDLYENEDLDAQEEAEILAFDEMYGDDEV